MFSMHFSLMSRSQTSPDVDLWDEPKQKHIHGPLDRPCFMKNLTLYISPLDLLTSNLTDAGVLQEPAAGVRRLANRERWVGVGVGQAAV